jgi:MOSC domain-containing protein YiiM
MARDSASPLEQLLNGPMRPGEVAWIGLRPERKAPVEPVRLATLVAGHGIEGDHYRTLRNGPRQVTLIAAEDLAAAASCLGLPAVGPELTRRNVMTRGVNLTALKDRRFRLGGALLEGSGTCDPCGLMERLLGPGGFNALRGRGGITARVLEDGEVRVGDAVVRVD